jgi:hypothetical protein
MSIKARLSKLEAKSPSDEDWKVFRVIGTRKRNARLALTG